MNIVVAIKRVPDTNSRIKIAENGTSIDDSQIEWIVSPYDEFAVEAALQLKEAHGGEVTVVSLAPGDATKELRTCLAMGADQAILLENDQASELSAQATAAALADAIGPLNADVVLTGKQAIDRDQGQVGSLLAARLGMPCATEIRKLEVADGKATIERAGDEGTSETWELPLPALLTCTKGLNEPRRASMKGIMQSKKKPIDQRPTEAPAAALSVRSLEPPPARRDGRIVGEGPDAVDELVRLLREEAKVL